MSRPLRFLFVMHYPGYLRYFDSLVRLLVDRGHQVEIAFDNPDKQADGCEAVAGMKGVEILGRMPTQWGTWKVVGRAIRGTVDYVRYLHPDFEDTPFLRDRMRSALPRVFRFIGRWTTATAATTQRLVALFSTCERAIPSSMVLKEFIRSRTPDAVLVTPLVTDRSPQVEVIKSAQALGIPTALCVGSWDHLTTKGLIRVQPDLVAVWNDTQRSEALQYHGVAADRIVVTGAQPFDKWFERKPSDRAVFCRKVGLDPSKPFALFVGSTASISSPDAELNFVRRWIAAVRQHPGLAHVGILVRPHPLNVGHWAGADLGGTPNAVIYPRAANIVNESDRQDYFDSLYHSAVVVGVNTTAMIEAAIVGRTVHSVLADEFKDTQRGTLHFRYLLSENGGFLRIARSMDEHTRQLAETVASPAIGRLACAAFVSRFIRPRGMDVAATPELTDAVERLARAGYRAPARMPAALYPLRVLLWICGASVTYGDPRAVVRRVRKAWRIQIKRVGAQRREIARRRAG